mmetsp:Transcript_56542/g.123960  ORF Transcript_56542/g.123960 Transcript_56542/m.123960 type:complete len:343 (-) Transcript_56542:24-1052(-)
MVHQPIKLREISLAGPHGTCGIALVSTNLLDKRFILARLLRKSVLYLHVQPFQIRNRLSKNSQIPLPIGDLSFESGHFLLLLLVFVLGQLERRANNSKLSSRLLQTALERSFLLCFDLHEAAEPLVLVLHFLLGLFQLFNRHEIAVPLHRRPLGLLLNIFQFTEHLILVPTQCVNFHRVCRQLLSQLSILCLSQAAPAAAVRRVAASQRLLHLHTLLCELVVGRLQAGLRSSLLLNSLKHRRLFLLQSRDLPVKVFSPVHQLLPLVHQRRHCLSWIHIFRRRLVATSAGCLLRSPISGPTDKSAVCSGIHCGLGEVPVELRQLLGLCPQLLQDAPLLIRSVP